MNDLYNRTKQLLGAEAIEKLKNKHIALFGVGGVGGFVFESLVRTGIGKIDIFDKDTVSESDMNRQLIASTNTIGMVKVEAAKERAHLINPDVYVNAHNVFYLPDNAGEYNMADYDYVIDAIDNVSAKLTLIEHAKKANTPIISCMGAGNKTDPSAFRVADISQTSICPLAKVMRRELKKRNIQNVKVVFSVEPPCLAAENNSHIGSISTVVGSAGLLLANEVLKDLIK